MPRRLSSLTLVLAAACTDYGFAGKEDQPGTADGGAETDPNEGDASDPAGTEGSGQDTLTEGACYDPGTAYDMHPAAGLVVTQDTIAFDIGFLGSSAGYTSELWVWEPERLWVGTGHETATGTTVSLGTLPVGTELEFAIVVTDNGYTYYSGPSTRNVDGYNHAAVTYIGACRWIVGFEDELGGGDQDFNDIQLSISGPLELVPVE